MARVGTRAEAPGAFVVTAVEGWTGMVSGERKSMLVVALPATVSSRLPPLLWKGSSFDVSHPADPRLALRAAAETRFDLVATAFPLPNITFQDFLDDIRGFGGSSRRAGVFAMARRDDLRAAEHHIGRGLNRVAGMDDSDERVAAAVRDLLDVAPRAPVRGTVRMYVDGHASTRTLVAQTVNVSRSGMLLRGNTDLTPGRRFRFEARLAPHEGVVRGTGEVVRLARRGVEGVDGIGVRLTSVEAGGGAVLDRVVARARGDDLTG